MSFGDYISRGDAAPLAGEGGKKMGLTAKQKKEGGHATPPKGYPAGKKDYADPANFKYPLDTAAHVRAAMSYLSMPKNRQMYSAAEIAAMMRRIKAAGKKFGIDFDADDK